MYHLGPEKNAIHSLKKTFNSGFWCQHSDNSKTGLYSVGDQTNIIFSPIPFHMCPAGSSTSPLDSSPSAVSSQIPLSHADPKKIITESQLVNQRHGDAK